jgi:uncharacterized membrane protein
MPISAAFHGRLKSAAARPGSLRPRFGVVDVARGAAVAAMVIYHSAWDLSELRLIEADIRAIAAWRWFAHGIAGSFLVLVGAGLVLAHGRALRPNPFLRRLAVIAGAAGLVTIGTYLVFPDAFVFFGILHCIALASILALPALRAPVPVVILVAALVMVAPLFLTQPVFDAPVLAFLGLGTRIPNTNDYVPLFPWFGLVLAGIAAMRLARPLLERRPERTRRYPAPLRGLAWAGRHSLIIYLLHQPLIFGAMAGWVELVGRSPAAEAAPYSRAFDRACTGAGQAPEICRSARDCMIRSLKESGLWQPVVENQVSAEQITRIGPLMQSCFERARAAP